MINKETKHIEMLINAINQGTKKFSYAEAPFLHDAMTNHFEFVTGLKLEDIINEGVNNDR